MRSILISKPPEQVTNIISGKQSVIISKTAPIRKFPVTAYIYCTKKGAVIEKDCGLCFPEHLNGKIVAKFTLNKVYWFCTRDFWGEYKEGVISVSDFADPAIVRKSCASQREIDEYTKGKPAFAWHISNLIVFDKPRELTEFYGTPKKIDGLYGPEMVDISLSEAPKSWCYVEEKE